MKIWNIGINLRKHHNLKNITEEDITDADYGQKDLGEYHDLYVKRDTLLLADYLKL